MTPEQLSSHVAAHGGVSQPIAERALRMVLAGLGARLDRATRELVSEELPASLAGWLDRGDAALPVEEHLLGLARTPGHARELVASVCRVLVEVLSTEALAAARTSVNDATIGPLLAEPSPAYSPPRTTRARGLASTHFGSGHPLDEARLDRRQSHSVAAENPHGDTKLSSVKPRRSP